ncbi:hypothetical protein PV10_06715 [Exophiala mesophila]|uniref:FAD-binding domain-containing protein n=1 Tax=Exophiala mesophila TaxID=212818 RepID=A0A0D1ZZJ4_EXOME|nr:uncharacterized protein PV10_06715 [Exophiala mesophila]KIV92258.1 hypothetical protein PV10_06715 [Exophiala mesophila]
MADLHSIPLPSYPAGSHNFLKRLRRDGPGSNAVVNGDLKPEGLDIAIVGAGVGGLAAAIALKREGFKVTVYENAPALSEIGAGIQVPPNSARLLHSWGLEASLSKHSVKPKGLLWRRWQDGREIGHARLNPQFSKWFGAPYYVIHRAHLHDILHQRARELGVDVVLNCKVVEYDPDKPAFTTGTGSTVTADLIIGADGENLGLRSVARRALLGNKYTGPVSCGLAAYRATVKREEMEADPDTAWVAESNSLNLWVGDNTHAMTYCIAGGRLFNMVLTHPETKSPETWDQTNALSEMKAVYAGWDPSLRKLLDMVSGTQKWPIQSVEIPSSWTSDSGRLALLGDAAHAMLPNMALGAAMAVEDAATLAACLKAYPRKETLRPALDIYEKLRIPRTRAIQEASVLHGYTLHYPDGPLQEARDAAMKPEVEGEHFIESPNQWSDPATQLFCYDYDPISEVDNEVRHLKSNGSPTHENHG